MSGHDLYALSERPTSISNAEISVPRLLDRIHRATTALEGWEAVRTQEDEIRNTAGPALPVSAVADVAKAYSLLRDIHRLVPAVMGWGVGYRWGTANRSWSCFTAHESVDEAGAFRERWAAKAAWSGRDEWIVRFCPCEITKFVKPGTDPERYVNESGAFRP